MELVGTQLLGGHENPDVARQKSSPGKRMRAVVIKLLSNRVLCLTELAIDPASNLEIHAFNLIEVPTLS